MPVLVRNSNDYEVLQWWSTFIKNLMLFDFYVPLVFALFVDVPTSMVWTISNASQLLTTYNYMNLKFPGNVKMFEEALDDFNQLSAFNKFVRYEDTFEHILGEEKKRRNTETSPYKQYGIDVYLRQKNGPNLVRNITSLLLIVPGLVALIGLIILIKSRLIDLFPRPVKAVFSFFERKLVYNSLLRLAMETYMPIALATCVGL